MNWKSFEDLARQCFSTCFGIKLAARKLPGFVKRFDLVSADGKIVGDAKYLSLVHGKKLPPAKFMEIAGHVWLLERTPAKRRLLVFGNQRRVPEWWLEKYGDLVESVEFYFLTTSGDTTGQPRSLALVHGIERAAATEEAWHPDERGRCRFHDTHPRRDGWSA